MGDELHEANRRRWDAAAAGWARGADRRGLWRRCPAEPHLVLCETELRCLGDLRGRRVAVLGSGDNEVVFALAGLGAEVTSVDISGKQLDVAAARAAELGLAVAFLRADVTDLSALADASFDAVHTGGHVAVWVSDLRRYYAEAARILRPGGLFAVDEYHPFRRVWRDRADSLVLEYPYFQRGPFEYDVSGEILGRPPGEMFSYEFHWTVADHIAAVLAAGCRLLAVEEYGDAVADWESAPLAGLPEHLLLIARREEESAPAADGRG